jgi:hypothetical protein
MLDASVEPWPTLTSMKVLQASYLPSLLEAEIPRESNIQVVA